MNQEVERHLALIPKHLRQQDYPAVSSKVKAVLQDLEAGAEVFSQYGVLGIRLETYGNGPQSGSSADSEPERNRLIYGNITAPWSAFICGSQGSGKSHTLSCLLENALLSPSKTGTITNPLAAIVFHYDKFTAFASTQLCEAAYLCSAGIPVRVLVSPSNFHAMQRQYANLPGIPASAPKPKVVPMYFREQHLNIAMMKTLMGVVTKILRDMARESRGSPGLNYRLFKKRLEAERFIRGQDAPLKMRLQLLESFLVLPGEDKGVPKDTWKFNPGTLTIIDLSCPFVDADDACALFNICLSLFLENRHDGGRLVALDEAHKFLTTNSSEAVEFTETLLSVIRQQRHLATRVVIATQEPTLSPSLLDLCNVTIVHRFTSPAWFKALEGHLAGAVIGKYRGGKKAAEGDEGEPLRLFDQIVRLTTGEALVFSPTAMLDVADEADDSSNTDGSNEWRSDSDTSAESMPTFQELGPRYVRVRVRARITVDGGRSILAE
ncbi:hypothetical protein T310_3004 [Rasamsonia emersonii CBS 393.64]|uniref:AAA+ ATPase domain-containing protein n=1 Tax=Rasamsonia emersonii (strain ATCC 16479 / CBS 393.64 / IMI 116815) TaxID=1408163 RepID=A0A0F4YZ96_RASE3|nr:hypothetical protein T310_3004 [Rasamsonia emersonii CBS 393.64]KKA22953.1 hypothetical protein T310_3004 [Rasamsonia emersonii CBS 393.64]